MSEVKETKKTKEKPFDITKEKYKVKLDRNQVGEENFLYVCNGARGVQVKRGIDVTVPFAVREAIRMAADAKRKQQAYEEAQEKRLESMAARMGGM